MQDYAQRYKPIYRPKPKKRVRLFVIFLIIDMLGCIYQLEYHKIQNHQLKKMKPMATYTVQSVTSPPIKKKSKKQKYLTQFDFYTLLPKMDISKAKREQ